MPPLHNTQRRYFAAFLWGGVAGLGFAPIHCTPALLLALAWLYKSLSTETHRFKLGWYFGFGQALACLYWLYTPLTFNWPRFVAFIPIVCLILPGYLALYTGLTSKIQLFFASSWKRGPALMAAQWTIAEWLMGQLFTGFPWILVGYTWLWPLSILQIAAYGGIHGVSFFTVLLGALFGEAWRRQHDVWKTPIVAACLLFCVVCGLGTLRLRCVTYEERPHPLVLRLVQGNIPQEVKWKAPLRMRHLETYLDLSRGGADTLPHIIVWPEAAFPFLFEPHSNLSLFLGQCLAPSQILLMGALRQEQKEVRNCLMALDASGHLLAQYDKVRLLPFGDYVPYAGFLPIQRVAQGLGLADTSPGTNGLWWNMTLPNVPKCTPLICYEVVFPRNFPFFRNRTEWLLNITNDAWFGRSSEPYQHAHICRFRAIEEGVPLVQVANTGKTCVFTAVGEETVSLPLYVTEYRDCVLPVPTKYPPLFSYLGSFPFIIVYCILAVFLRYIPNKIKERRRSTMLS
ncbi:MAG: apolipoprotein N-acyltransferase [Holosporales bacterium]|jgi:apolipoprotein N-acyltransferase|nr:apolipoprotein N-acyltransferase [Holosporales bacterium]